MASSLTREEINDIAATARVSATEVPAEVKSTYALEQQMTLAEVSSEGIWDYRTILNRYSVALSKRLRVVAARFGERYFKQQKKRFLLRIFEEVLRNHSLHKDFAPQKNPYEEFRSEVLREIEQKTFSNVMELREAVLNVAQTRLSKKLRKNLADALLPISLNAAGIARDSFLGYAPLDIIAPSGGKVRILLGLEIHGVVLADGNIFLRGPASDERLPRDPVLMIAIQPLSSNGFLPTRDEWIAVAKLANDAAKPLAKKGR